MNQGEREIMLKTYRGWVARLFYCATQVTQFKKDEAEAQKNVNNIGAILEKMEPGILEAEAKRAKMAPKKKGF